MMSLVKVLAKVLVTFFTNVTSSTLVPKTEVV